MTFFARDVAREGMERASATSARRRRAVSFMVAVGLSIARAAGPAEAQSPVAAYSFGEGTGTTVAEASGSGNTGTIQNATWTAAGRFGGGLVFNGTNARINVPDSPSLRLTSGMTLEAWVNPSVVSAAWRDVIYKGNDNYFLEA